MTAAKRAPKKPADKTPRTWVSGPGREVEADDPLGLRPMNVAGLRQLIGWRELHIARVEETLAKSEALDEAENVSLAKYLAGERAVLAQMVAELESRPKEDDARVG